jgi:hypothetical protein
MDIRGKDYLQVAYRLVWFREHHPHWAIETEPLELAPDHAIFRAAVKDETGRIIATGTKQETKSGFFDFIEKAETGAIGRALALCGYGTQFAPELDEGDRLVDSPLDGSAGPPPPEWGEDRARTGLSAPSNGGHPLPRRLPQQLQKATPRQLKFVADLAIQKLGANPEDKEDILAKLNEKFGFELTASAELSVARANTIIDSLKALPEARRSRTRLIEDAAEEDPR